jgi:hypothetical protein
MENDSMRISIVAALTFAGLSVSGLAAAQTPAPAPAPPAPAPAAAPAPAPAPAAAPEPAPAAAPAAAAPAAPAAAPAATPPPGNWYDKFSADAFVDTYGAISWFDPLRAVPSPLAPSPATTNLRAFDPYQGFALNWVGINASYAADPIGATIGLRIGPGAGLYNGGVQSPDNNNGLEYVKQAYATWKATSSLTLDMGKWDEPFGSEVADSQLNMNYSRSVLFWELQPLFFTGLRANYAVSGNVNVLLFAANGWNETLDNNSGKTFGGQLMVKPADILTLYAGYAGGSEQNDLAVGAMGGVTKVSGAPSNWRHLVDVVADLDPTAALRFLLNFDWRTEDNFGAGHSAVEYGANLVIRYNFSDAFNAAIRGEFVHDEHGDILGTKNVEDGTLTLTYGLGTHLAFMLDNRIDVADDPIFFNNTPGNLGKTQFTTTLGVIASTK